MILMLLGTLGAAYAVVLAAFAVGVATGRHAGVDVAWGLGFVAVAITGALLSGGDPPMVRLVTALTVAWGVRLAVHIALRNRGMGEDPRYERLLARAPGNRTAYAFRVIYLFQGAVLWFVSLPVQMAQRYATLSAWAAVGVVLWLVGFLFETVGDRQLERFRRDPASKGRVLDTGLWRYTRHPNYFGDACVWWGLYALACLSWQGALTVLSPLLMTYLLVAKTGKPLLERSLTRNRPGYADYAERTSGFVPRRPRRVPDQPSTPA
jgi:steroid 5-alpha reductase family enzyme